MSKMKSLIEGGRCHSTILATETDLKRLVVVRYYLDRPGMDLNHSSARLWKNPPATCMAKDVIKFLEEQGIKEPNDNNDNMLVEIYLDQFGAYMLTDVCCTDIGLDFNDATIDNPGVLNIRLTDVNVDPVTLTNSSNIQTQSSNRNMQCNMSPLGLFAFTMTVGFENSALISELTNGKFVSESFILTWAPYAIFISGLLQLLVGMWEVTRNNVYGATAFSAFGCFWLANGLKMYTETVFGSQIDPELLTTPDPWGLFIRHLFILGLTCNLVYATLSMNMTSTVLTTLLSCNMFFAMIAPFSQPCKWIQLVFGWLLTIVALYTFTVEFINEVYNREVINMFRWNNDSPNEVFGAAGRSNSLVHKKVTMLRTAAISNKNKGTNHIQVRGAAAASYKNSTKKIVEINDNHVNHQTTASTSMNGNN